MSVVVAGSRIWRPVHGRVAGSERIGDVVVVRPRGRAAIYGPDNVTVAGRPPSVARVVRHVDTGTAIRLMIDGLRTRPVL